MATKTRKASVKTTRKRRSTRKGGMRAATRSTTKVRVTATKRRSPKRSKQSPVARVKRVTREVVQQATVAVTAGVETLKGLGGNLVDRVRA
jgi:hypothetical protein